MDDGVVYFEQHEWPQADLWAASKIEQGKTVFSILDDEFLLCVASDMEEALAVLAEAFDFPDITEDDVKSSLNITEIGL